MTDLDSLKKLAEANKRMAANAVLGVGSWDQSVYDAYAKVAHVDVILALIARIGELERNQRTPNFVEACPKCGVFKQHLALQGRHDDNCGGNMTEVGRRERCPIPSATRRAGR